MFGAQLADARRELADRALPLALRRRVRVELGLELAQRLAHRLLLHRRQRRAGRQLAAQLRQQRDARVVRGTLLGERNQRRRGCTVPRSEL